jgi:hypothetical protein
MATVSQGNIQVGSSRIVGRVSIDPGGVRGEGGPYEPRLVVPLSIEMHSRPGDEMLALTRLKAVLHDGAVNVRNTEVGHPVELDLANNMRYRSLPDGSSPSTVDLRFPLTAASVDRLEQARQRTAPGGQFLHVSLEGTVAWLERTYGQIPTSTDTSPFQTMMGLHSALTVFWITTIDTLSLGIDPSVWIANVIPGLGVDRLRLVEVHLPPSVADATASKKWDDAQTAFQQQKYDDCVSHCRGLIRAWNRKLGASKQQHLAEIVASRNGWADDDPRRNLLDAVWQGLLDVANAPHHDEDRGSAFNATAADAEFHQLMTAIVSDYVAKLAPS